jgi:3-methyl-2-oxobutanoate hydroxymethyltransferase
MHDMLGLFPDLEPRFVKQFADMGAAVTEAAKSYCREVRENTFPAKEHEFR